MSDLVGNPDCRFSHAKALSNNDMASGMALFSLAVTRPLSDQHQNNR